MKIKERIIETLLLSSAVASIAIIVAMAYYLFSVGFEIFTKSPLDDFTVIIVNESNPVSELRPLQLKAIKGGEIVNWSELSTFDQKIDYVTYRSVEGEAAIEQQESERLIDYVRANPGAIAPVFEYDLEGLGGFKTVSVPKVGVFDFLLGEFWYPISEPVKMLGVLPMILGSLFVTLGAIALALPISIGCAVYLSELAAPGVRNAIKPVIELLAGIPSVVFGFFGLVVVVPFIRELFDLNTGESGLSGAVILALMIIPTIVSMSEDAMRNVPTRLRAASLALGATQWQTIYKVVIPSALSGISASIMLGVGRAIGETMAVLMVTGNAAVIPEGFLTSMRTLTATIAAELGEAPYGGLHFQSLFTIGCVLFIFTLLINIAAEFVSRRYSLKV